MSVPVCDGRDSCPNTDWAVLAALWHWPAGFRFFVTLNQCPLPLLLPSVLAYSSCISGEHCCVRNAWLCICWHLTAFPTCPPEAQVVKGLLHALSILHGSHSLAQLGVISKLSHCVDHSRYSTQVIDKNQEEYWAQNTDLQDAREYLFPKALAKSRKITSYGTPSSTALVTFSMNSRRLVQQNLPGRNPCCSWLISFFFSEWLMIPSLTRVFRILKQTDVRDTGL